MTTNWILKYPPLTITEAKRLTHRENRPYAIIEDQEKIEWLVEAVLDQGRIMIIIQMHTDGKIEKVINCDQYDQYICNLGGDDLDRISEDHNL